MGVFGREDITFEELGFPLAFTATNIRTRKVEFLHAGPILPALLVSATLPAINPPQYIDGIPYIDGGITLNMPRRIPASIKRSEPYLGINVAYGRRFRSNKIDLWRKCLVNGLSLWHKLIDASPVAESSGHAHELLTSIKLHQIVIAAPQINRGDFEKIKLAAQLGYEATVSQLPPVNLSYEPEHHMQRSENLQLHASHS